MGRRARASGERRGAWHASAPGSDPRPPPQWTAPRGCAPARARCVERAQMRRSVCLRAVCFSGGAAVRARRARASAAQRRGGELPGPAGRRPGPRLAGRSGERTLASWCLIFWHSSSSFSSWLCSASALSLASCAPLLAREPTETAPPAGTGEHLPSEAAPSSVDGAAAAPLFIHFRNMLLPSRGMRERRQPQRQQSQQQRLVWEGIAAPAASCSAEQWRAQSPSSDVRVNLFTALL